ncbi:kinase-like domain-containing protein [Pilobolus umbonatus]|nr:kinase-like domain-containing protein [Pilobolus umbonatus]
MATSEAEHRQSIHYSPSVWHEEIYKQYGYDPKNRNPTYFGPYLLLQTLGEGEFAKVKAAVHVNTNQDVAIKLMRKDHIKHASLETKLEREISVLKTVQHPYIVKLFEVISIKNYIGIVLQRAVGGELFDYILKHHFLQENEAKRLFAQLISGVQYMHQKHIVHRDLKLENLLLTKNRDIVITDFGFANHFKLESEDLMATSCGSPCYAAPELVISDENQYVGTAVDIWSCGVILFAMLCGYLPYDDDPNNPQGANINVLYKYIVNTPLELPNNMSPDVKHLLSRMLVPDPTKRCTMKDITTHPWLADYTALLNKSVDQLELDANAIFLHHMTPHSDSRYTPPVVTSDKVTQPQDEEKTTMVTTGNTRHSSTSSTNNTKAEPEDRKERHRQSKLVEAHPESEPIEKRKKKVSRQSTTTPPSSFLQTKFFSTIQRHVTPNKRASIHTTQIPFRSHSVQQSNYNRRDRTWSETMVKEKQHPPLNILPSVSEQTFIHADEMAYHDLSKQKTKGQKLMEWFKRGKHSISHNSKDMQFSPSDKHHSALPNLFRSTAFNGYGPDFNDSKLRLHRGTVDQDALTSRSPHEVLTNIKESLQLMGIEMKKCNDFKIKCIRHQQQQKRTRRISASTPFKILFQRDHPAQFTDLPAQQHTTHTPHTMYGDQSIDSGEEIQFSVEISKIENLSGLYVVDIRRIRGNIWAFKFLYHTLLDLLDLRGTHGYMAHRRASQTDKHYRKSYMTADSSSGSSMMIFDEIMSH